jgi:hypothetical protein
MSSRKPPVAGNPSLTVIRIMLGACVAGALSVATGLVPMSGYVNEAEMLHSTKDERAKLKPHRFVGSADSLNIGERTPAGVHLRWQSHC